MRIHSILALTALSLGLGAEFAQAPKAPFNSYARRRHAAAFTKAQGVVESTDAEIKAWNIVVEAKKKAKAQAKGKP